MGASFTFDSITFSKNSPQKVKIENIHINIQHLNIHTNSENHKPDNAKSRIDYILSTVIQALAGLSILMTNLNGLYFSNEQKNELEKCSQKLRGNIAITELHINKGTQNCISYDGEKLKKHMIEGYT